MVSDPVNLYDVAPLADGAAALLAGPSLRPDGDRTRPPVRVRGLGRGHLRLALHDQPRPAGAAGGAGCRPTAAYAQAGVGPADIDVFELHDSFTIYAALALEAAGFAARGRGLAPGGARADRPSTGTLPMLTFGGSKARGEAGGATGVYQIAEVVLQLQGRAGGNQVPGARRGWPSAWAAAVGRPSRTPPGSRPDSS